MQYQIFEENTGDLIAWIDTKKENQVVKNGYSIKAGKHLTVVSHEETEMNEEFCAVKEQNELLKMENEKLHCKLMDAEKCIFNLQKTIEEDIQPVQCGCVVIEHSTCYQDLVGILINNGYAVEVAPIHNGSSLRITISQEG